MLCSSKKTKVTDTLPKSQIKYMAPNGNGAARTARVIEMAAPAVGRPKPSLQFENSTEALDMTSEVDRLKTFTKWPVSFISKSAMASAGFYYTNKADIVRCAYCSVEVGRWEVGDKPMEEHKRWSPSCFLFRSKMAGNDVKQSVNTASCERRKPAYDVCGLYGVEIRPNSGPENGKRNEKHLLEQTGVNKFRAPKFAALASIDVRMKSFDSWPKSLKPRPEELAEAGFFYTGKGDQTLCFACGVGLRNWQPTDDPWVEHCRWSSKCMFVILNKGRDFIQKAVDGKQPIVSSEDIENSAHSEEHSQPDEKLKSLCSEPSSDPAGEEHETSNDSTLCKICYKEELGVVFLPCSHLVACVNCSLAVSNCPICRKPVTATVRAFLS